MDSRRLFTFIGIALLTSLMGATEVYARSGVSRSASGDPLCNNPNMTGSRREGCRVILQQLTSESSCTKPILDRIASAAARGQFRGMDRFCPNYAQFNRNASTRALIWRNIIAALVTEESSWNPNEKGDGGRSRGLLQIGYSNTQQGPYKCACRAASQNINNAAANAQCGTHIYLHNVARDMSMGGGPAGRPGSYGAARFFGPYGDAQSKKRSRMAGKIASYCRSLPIPSAPKPAPAPSAPAAPVTIAQPERGSSSGGAAAVTERMIYPPRQSSSHTTAPRHAPPASVSTRASSSYSSGFLFSFD